jgi:hypothetical protein
MLLQLMRVGRKTPGDGRLEIAAETAQRLTIVGETFPIRVADAPSVAVVTSMVCTCGKGDTPGEHRHWFLACELFRGLRVDEHVALELLDERELILARPHPLEPSPDAGA